MNNDLNPSNNHHQHPLPSPMLPNPNPPSNLQSAARPPNPNHPPLGSHHLRFTPQTPALLSHPDDNPGPWTRRSASWSRAEDERLAQLVQLEEANAPTTTPTKMWSRVATQLTGRTGKQCRERWLNQLKPGIRRGQWTEEEELILHSAHAELGNKWVAIAQRLPGRTDNCVKNHWNSMLRKRQRREAALRSAELAGTGRGRSHVPRAPASLPISTPLGAVPEVSSDLARRATTIADARNVPQMPPANFYDMVHATNPGAFEPLSRGLIDSVPSLSPITPQRNSKIQIANLVQPHRSRVNSMVDSAQHSNETLASAALTGHNSLSFDSRTPTASDRVTGTQSEPSTYGAKLQPPVHQMQTQLPGPGLMFSDPNALPLAADTSLANLTSVGLINPFARKDDNTHPQAAAAAAYSTGAPFLANTISPVTTPVAGMGPNYPSLDQRMWNPPTFSVNQQQHQHVNHLRRRSSVRSNAGESSELASSMEKNAERIPHGMAAGSAVVGGGSVGVGVGGSEKNGPNNMTPGGKLGTVKSIMKTPVRRGSNGASLAALAQVASSVPPSPLTPESRFSSTSRSASPLPRHAAPGDTEDGDIEGTMVGDADTTRGSEARTVRTRRTRREK